MRDADFEVEASREEFLNRILPDAGVSDGRVRSAMARVRREGFVPPELVPFAYLDRPLPLSLGQTISQPSLVAYMTQALDCDETSRVLEVGTGSGYQTAVLAELAHRVYSVERLPELAESAAARLTRLGYENVRVKIADGSEGWGEMAPFHRIMVTAGAAQIPTGLLDQLAPGGRMVIPVGEGEQQLFLVEKRETGYEIKSLGAVAFVPLVPGTADRLAG